MHAKHATSLKIAAAAAIFTSVFAAKLAFCNTPRAQGNLFLEKYSSGVFSDTLRARQDIKMSPGINKSNAFQIAAEFPLTLDAAYKIVCLADSINSLSADGLGKEAVFVSPRTAVEKAILMERDGSFDKYVRNLEDVAEMLSNTGFPESAKAIGLYVEIMRLASGRAR
ncbi:MAG: hypothetical protein WC506_02305 [Candidatus Micrarchaeia archaeon]